MFQEERWSMIDEIDKYENIFQALNRMWILKLVTKQANLVVMAVLTFDIKDPEL